MFVVYTYFGRVLGTFPIGDNETHHKAAEKAREFLLSQGKTCWIKFSKN